MRIGRPARPVRAVPLVPLVDVLLILLVFFMVTSTYLDLDFLPLAGDGDAVAVPPPPRADESDGASTLLVRIRDDGRYALRGRTLDAATLPTALGEWVAERPEGSVVVLPSGAASVQSLVSLVEAAGAARVEALRVVRLGEPG